ncbi:hypothetical protein [Clostridium sp. Ade.TY]|uniref:hypothetical protein n=1 Tax=Clostridium sp. Ade.TY TaxID=1391647 RepID=UPI00040ED326|nr:hypothetical protein [Clostridium sp. Ade.TY]
MTFRSDYSPNQSLPEEVKYFKEEIINEVLTLPDKKPNMERMLKPLVSISVEDKKLIKTEKGLSNEGQNLTGWKLVVKLRIKEKITYVADRCTQSVHAAHYETIQNLFIILPEKIDGELVCDLFKKSKLSITPYVECVEARMLDNRSIHKCVMLLVDVKKI